MSKRSDALKAEAKNLARLAGYKPDARGRLHALPGKFEGEPFYVPFYYDEMMNGAETDTLYDGDTPIAVFEIDNDEREAFDLDDATMYVVLWETDDGFVMFARWTDADYTAQLEHNFESDDIDESDDAFMH